VRFPGRGQLVEASASSAISGGFMATAASRAPLHVTPLILDRDAATCCRPRKGASQIDYQDIG
jgi:hypothetical protein